MPPFLKQGSRLVDLLALAALVATVIGFAMLLTSIQMPTESEWRRLIGAPWITSLEQSPEMFANPDAFDTDDASPR